MRLFVKRTAKLVIIWNILIFDPCPIVNLKSPMSLFERQTALAKRSDVKSQSGANIKETWQIRQGFLFI